MRTICHGSDQQSDGILMFDSTEGQLNPAIQIEQVDNWHPRWEQVLEAVEQLGQRDTLCLDADGWLSARRVVLVAFIDDEVAGHVSFRVQPVQRKHGCIPSGRERPMVEAQLESYGVQWEFSDDEVGGVLRIAAIRRARLLGCTRLVGLDEPDMDETGGGSGDEFA